MNRDCHGDHFSVRGEHFYCCFLDSAVVSDVPNGEPCPNCHRAVNAQDAGELPTETHEYATLPQRGEVLIRRIKS